VAFSAFYNVGPTPGQGIFLDSLADLAQTVVKLGGSSPVSDSFFQNVQPSGQRFVLNDSGLVVFDASIGPTANSALYGLFAWRPGAAIEKLC